MNSNLSIKAKGGGGCTSACIYIGTKSQPNFKIAPWLFTNRRRDKVLIFVLAFWSNLPRGRSMAGP